MSPSTSPGSACRPSAFLENSKYPSTATSNTPPDDSTSLTLASEYDFPISAARPVARDSYPQTTQYWIVILIVLDNSEGELGQS